jgi:hypothetical protein
MAAFGQKRSSARKVSPVAIAGQEILEGPIGLLFANSALLLHPPEALIASSSGRNLRVNAEYSPGFLQSPLELRADTSQAIPIHIDLPMLSIRHRPW